MKALGAPVYARAFTANIARRKMEEQGTRPRRCDRQPPGPSRSKVGPFTVGFLPVSHSIPESAGLVIDSPAGRVVHTGDFKLDSEAGGGRAV